VDVERLLDDRFGSGAPELGRTELPATVELMLAHRSCRSFALKPVEEGLVTTVMAAAMSSPSKSDLQQTTVLWLENTELKSSVLGLLPRPDYDWVDDAPEVLFFCADNRRIRRAAARLGRPFPNNHLDQFMNAAVDTGIVLGAAVTAAEAHGLGTCPLSELRDRAGDLIDLLELPEGVVPIAGLVLGWPDRAPRPITQRLPFRVQVQRNTYSDASFDAAFDDYEQERDRREARPDDRQRDVERYGVARPYGWAEDRTRQHAVPVREDWAEHVERQGFDLS
jgi:nitroreductase/FMN reductase [NAD(P)H]